MIAPSMAIAASGTGWRPRVCTCYSRIRLAKAPEVPCLGSGPEPPYCTGPLTIHSTLYVTSRPTEIE
jgi:hypothetical protein